MPRCWQYAQSDPTSRRWAVSAQSGPPGARRLLTGRESSPERTMSQAAFGECCAKISTSQPGPTAGKQAKAPA
jgi:hypothetical protein